METHIKQITKYQRIKMLQKLPLKFYKVWLSWLYILEKFFLSLGIKSYQCGCTGFIKRFKIIFKVEFYSLHLVVNKDAIYINIINIFSNGNPQNLYGAKKNRYQTLMFCRKICKFGRILLICFHGVVN